MARATTSTFGQFKILLGDGATPEVFTPICGLTSKGVNFNSNTNTSDVPDCTDEDAPSYQETDVVSQIVTLTGSGMWAAQSHGILMDWWKSNTNKNIKVQYVNAATGDTEYVNGPAKLTSIGHTVERGNKLAAELSIVFSAMPTFVDKV